MSCVLREAVFRGGVRFLFNPLFFNIEHSLQITSYINKYTFNILSLKKARYAISSSLESRVR